MDEFTKSIILENGDEQKLKNEFIKQFEEQESKREDTLRESIFGRSSMEERIEKAWQEHLQNKYDQILADAQRLLSNKFLKNSKSDFQNNIDNMVKENEWRANFPSENAGLFTKIVYALGILSHPNLLGNSNQISGSKELVSPLPFNDKSPILSSTSMASALASMNNNANILTATNKPNSEDSTKVTLMSGPEGTEFQVNTHTDNYQHSPSITKLQDGGFAVSWTSYFQDGSYDGVYAQVYNADGTKRSTELPVNTRTDNYQHSSSVAGLQDGGFVVSWTSYFQDGSYDGVYAQIFNADGTKRGVELKVNTFTLNNQARPSVAGLYDGDFIITWHSQQDGSNYGIFAQRYDMNGITKGDEFLVNTHTLNWQYNPKVTPLKDEGFLIIWQSARDGSGYGIYAQRYNKYSIKVGSEFQIHTTTANSQEYPSIASLEDGGFVAVWQSDNNQDGSGNGIYGQVFNADNTKRGSEFLVNTHTDNDQSLPSVAGIQDGGFVVVWESVNQDGSGKGIYGQIFHANGIKNGQEFLVNTCITSDQSSPAITALKYGGFVAGWTSDGQDGSYEGVFGQRFDNNGNKTSLFQDIPNITLTVTPTKTEEPSNNNPGKSLSTWQIMLCISGIVASIPGLGCLTNLIWKNRKNIANFCKNGKCPTKTDEENKDPAVITINVAGGNQLVTSTHNSSNGRHSVVVNLVSPNPSQTQQSNDGGIAHP